MVKRLITVLLVVPYIGTWIETSVQDCVQSEGMVVPYIGTWIETSERLLKISSFRGRTLYRYVD